MSEMVSFSANGDDCPGYFAPAEGGGPGVIVIQEWWGLNSQIKGVADTFAAAGFSAVVPDLFRGEVTTEPDEAGKLMMSLSLDQAGKDISGAVDFLLGRAEVTSDKVGIVGFCMGGALALMGATLRPDAIVACAPFYGVVPFLQPEPDWSRLAGKVRGHFAEHDDYFTPELVAGLEGRLKDLGKDVELRVHPGVHHAFANEQRPEVFDAAATDAAMNAMLELFRSELS
jgi:carboxymethylenebutenolidase